MNAAAPLSVMNTVTASAPEAATATDSASKWRMLARAKQLIAEDVPRFYLCNHTPNKRALEIAIKAKGGASWFSGVYQCGSVWTCPVCSRRVSELRRKEIQTAIDNAINVGYGVLLVTFTFPHGAGDNLQVILDKFSQAQKLVKSGRPATALRESIRYFGEIRTLEVTHGMNGWHPHVHSLWFTRKTLDQAAVDQFADALYQQWRAACLAAGLPEPSREHGVDVRVAKADIAEYVAKWGFAGELAYGPRKKGKRGGFTPWQLLAAATKETEARAKQQDSASAKWREFALAFFGKKQLFWSRRKTGRKVKRTVYKRGRWEWPPGESRRFVETKDGKRYKIGVELRDEWITLRHELNMVAELTDQQLLALDDEAPEETERTRTPALIDLDTWHAIRKAGAQARVLDLALGDVRELHGFLNHLRSTVPMEDGLPPGIREDWAA